MKKLIYCSALFLLIAGCSQQNSLETSGGDSNKTEPVNEAVAAEKTENEDKETEIEEETESEDGEENEQEDASMEETVKEPQYTINEANWSVQPIGDANEKVALLTIDDAPDKHSLEMAETLKSLNAPAIFFVNGHFLDTEEEKETLKKIHEMGFPIGNHTATHASLPDLTEEEQQAEIVEFNKLITSIIGEKPKFFRAPFGQNTDYSKGLAKSEKMILMNWTYGYDWEAEYQNKEGIADIMVNTELLSNGANLLMHDRTWTSEAMADIVMGLRDKGFEILDPELIETPQ
ncbi:polysaccharide deacetylase family protein [Rossellomorea vietnamensis]|uniref:Polysaccharide deacetylase family protein n=1 Tax=Rossellomorea vietnamensis TaxID=218284 RepID=A0A5D4MA06_9BACI|nr:polysaccharide deacetylase family protein [Rossellomorea vietnamensis]TYR98401.1 polysaccharide deacetylase family protein [Rossellomorea vietnamensis]